MVEAPSQRRSKGVCGGGLKGEEDEVGRLGPNNVT